MITEEFNDKSEATLKLKYWDTKSITFPFGTNGKLMDLDVQILKHLRVSLLVFLENKKHILCSSLHPLNAIVLMRTITKFTDKSIAKKVSSLSDLFSGTLLTACSKLSGHILDNFFLLKINKLLPSK